MFKKTFKSLSRKTLFGRSSLAALVVLLALAGCAGTGDIATEAYQPDEDVYIVFHGEHFDTATEFLPNDVITGATFELQEGTHEAITDVSGAEVDHYYIWLCLGQACIPVDPFSYNY